jgi:hypothetical protein
MTENIEMILTQKTVSSESIPVSYPGFVGDMRGLEAQVRVE